MGTRKRRAVRRIGQRLVAILGFLLAAHVAVGQEGPEVQLPVPQTDGGTYRFMAGADVDEARTADLHSDPVSYLGLLPGIVALTALIAGRRRLQAALPVLALLLLPGLDTDLARQVDDGLKAVVLGDFVSAGTHFAVVEAATGPNAALAYNQALCYYALGERARSIAALHRALALDPGRALYRDVLLRIENGYGLDDPIVRPRTVDPDIPFVGAIVMANLTLISLGLVLVFRRGFLAILFVLSLSGAIAFGAWLLRVEAVRFDPVRVVAVDRSPLKRAPVADASPWIHLSEGLTVRLRGEAAGYALVKTGHGLEGWIEGSALVDPGRLLLFDRPTDLR